MLLKLEFGAEEIKIGSKKSKCVLLKQISRQSLTNNTGRNIIS